MRVMVVGKGGREHALCWRLNQSPSVWKLFCTIGNPGINSLATPVPVEPNDVKRLADFAAQERIDLTVVGPEEPLTLGIADEFAARGLTLIGPTKAAAQLEASKSFAKQIMREAGVPTADFAVFDDLEQARAHVRRMCGPMVVKADGLAAGKGVAVCEGVEQALRAVDDAMARGVFGAAGRRVVIEERLAGQEVSFFALCDGTGAMALGMAQDHKPVFDGDRGPNTGGMGAYSPTPFVSDAELKKIGEQILTPWRQGCAAEGIDFRGILYPGIMLTRDGPRVLEFNARFGDPETQVYLTRLENDLVELLHASADGALDKIELTWKPQASLCVVMASAGYPGNYEKGKPISGLDDAAQLPGVKIFHAGTAWKNGQIVTHGGRVLGVTALGRDLKAAQTAAYAAVEKIHFDGAHFRRDIASRGLNLPTRHGADCRSSSKAALK